ncbi:MAG: hypothetical protein QM532_03795 [Cyanobium sp. MAG06]|nr:hypothetical protein [Cyanobium sp. MAG06]
MVLELYKKYNKKFIILGVGNKYERYILSYLENVFIKNGMDYANLLGIKDFNNVITILNNSFLNIGANTGLTLISFYLDKYTVIFSEYMRFNYQNFTSKNNHYFMNNQMCICNAKINNDIDNYNKNSIIGCCLDKIDISKIIKEMR